MIPPKYIALVIFVIAEIILFIYFIKDKQLNVRHIRQQTIRQSH